MKKLSEIKAWKEMINQVIHGDCLEGMKMIPDKNIDLILTDPPYGIAYSAQKQHFQGSKLFTPILGDDKEIDFSFLLIRPETMIMFGANNYYKQLPHKGTWICWDKRVIDSADKVFGSAFELAWCSKKTGYYKIYRVQHGGIINADASRPGDNRVPRQHPTQKPVELMRQIILDYTKEGGLVCDPFMGSWTTARACKDLGRNFIGFELEEKYCKIGEQRLRQENLF